MNFKFPLLLIFTLKVNSNADLADLVKEVARIKKSHRKLRRLKVGRSTKYGVASIEIKKNEEGWYIHLNCLTDAVWVNIKEIREAWFRITGDSHVVLLKRVKKSLIKHMFKYITKTPRLNEDDRIMLEETLKRQRLFYTFGKRLKNLNYTKHRKNKKITCVYCGEILILIRISNLIDDSTEIRNPRSPPFRDF